MSDRSQSGGVLLIGAAILALAAAALGWWLGNGTFRPPAAPPALPQVQAGTLLPQPKALAPFTLTGEDGEPLGKEDLAGRWTFVFFGYTHCPDICPTTLATLTQVDKRLADAGEGTRPRVLFVSVDPERDTPERLAEYVGYFAPDFRGATADREELQALTRQLGVLYARSEGQETAMGYLVDHSGAVLLLDPQVRLTAIFSAPHDPEALAADFRSIALP